MSFLKAEWRKLIMVNYAIDPSVLQSFVPIHTELDFWEDQCFISLVGFRFVNTRMLGLKIPFHVNFDEVNLRFYVRHKENGEWKRGVVFIKEIVPKPALTLVANTLYREHYQTLPMRHEWKTTHKNLSISYSWKVQKEWQSVSVETQLNSVPIERGSQTEFITEHYWGYTKITDNKTYEYEVTHPKWEHYPVKRYQLNVDYGKTYGTPFSFLNNEKPSSVFLAEGSTITVENKRKL